jgi:hypothetical protein
VAKPIPKIKAGNSLAAGNGQHWAQVATGVVGVVAGVFRHVALQLMSPSLLQVARTVQWIICHVPDQFLLPCRKRIALCTQRILPPAGTP